MPIGGHTVHQAGASGEKKRTVTAHTPIDCGSIDRAASVG